jgi:polyisoprenoid-binding protein YceI
MATLTRNEKIGVADVRMKSIDQEETGVAVDLVPPGIWAVDPSRSTVGFAVKHMLGTVRGRFTTFAGELESGPEGTRASGSVVAASIQTSEPVRDENLRGPPFLDVARHPEIRFDSRGVERADTGSFWVHGDLAIAGKTRPVRMLATPLTDGAPDHATVQVRGTVDRRQFGVTSNSLLEAGVGDKVEIELDLFAVRRPGSGG